MTVQRKEVVATLKGMYERPLSRISEIRERVEKQAFGPRGTDACAAGDLMALLLSMEDDVVSKYVSVKKSFMPTGDGETAETSDYVEVTRELFSFDRLPPMLLYRVCYCEYAMEADTGGIASYHVWGEQYFVSVEDAMNCFSRRIASRNPREAAHMKKEFFPSEVRGFVASLHDMKRAG